MLGWNLKFINRKEIKNIFKDNALSKFCVEISISNETETTAENSSYSLKKKFKHIGEKYGFSSILLLQLKVSKGKIIRYSHLL